MTVRQDYVSLALGSYPVLCGLLAQLTEDELHAALASEAAGKRRPSMLNRMIRRLVHLIESRTRAELQEKYMHEPSDIMTAEVGVTATTEAEVKKPKKRKSKKKVAKAKKKRK